MSNPLSGVKGRALVAVRRNLRTECGYFVRKHGNSARRRAVKRPKGAKGVWGKTRVFPHMQHVVFVEPFLRNSPVDCFGSIRRRVFRRSRGRALTLPYFYSSICLPKYIAAAWTSALCSFVANSLSSPESMITAPLTSPCESIGAAAIA